MNVLEETLPKNPRVRARVIVGLTLWLTVGAVFVIVTAMTGGLPLVGQVAWAADVDKKIQETVNPIKAQVSQLENAVKAQTSVSNSLLANITASQIRATYARICAKPSDAERERLNGDFDRYLAEYPKYADGRNFPLESLRCNPP